MIIDSGWDFISLATLRWGDTMGTAARQFVVLGDHHWWFYGTKDLATDPRQDPSAWAQEVLSHADEDYVRYLAVVMEVPSARIDYAPNAYPFDNELRDRAEQRGLHHMGCYFVDPTWWSGTGPAKTFSTYVGSENYPTVVSNAAVNYPEPRRLTPGTGPTPSPAPSDAKGSVHA